MNSKMLLLIAAGLFAGSLSAETNWKTWIRPAGTVTKADSAEFDAPAGKRTEFAHKFKLENGNFYKFSFDLEFSGNVPETFKFGFFNHELPFSFMETKAGKGKLSPVFYIYAKKDFDLWFRCYFVAKTDLKGVFSNPKLEKLSADALKKITIPENTENSSNWFQATWMKNALNIETVDAEDHIDEGKAVKVSIPEGSKVRSADLRSNAIPLLPETDYKASVWIKGSGMGSGTIGIDTWINRRTKHYYANGSIPISKEWELVEFAFRTPSVEEQPALEYRSARAKLGFRPNAELTEIQFKDFTLEQMK